MYGQGQGTGAAAAGVAGVSVAALPKTGDNTMLSVMAITAIVCALAAIAMQLVIGGYRRRALKNL